MNRAFPTFVCFTLIVVPVACGRAPVTAGPIANSALVSPTHTPVPSAFATSTKIATAVVPSTGLSPTPGPLTAAMKKTLEGHAYRVAFQLYVRQGNAPDYVLNLQNDVNGEDTHYSYQLGGEQIELIFVRGQSFAKGARRIGLPTTTKWYALPQNIADAARPPFSPEDVLTDFAARAASAADQPLARQVLDGQNCQVWRSVPSSLDETGLGSALGLSQDAGSFGTIDQSEIKLWVCDDAALHQLSIDIAAHNPRQASEKGTVKLLLHVWDFNAPIKIDPPANAEPLRLSTPNP